MAFSFIHISDIHLGRAFSNLSTYSFDESIKSLYENAVEVAFNNFINFAIEKNIDFVLISGDTFDNTAQDFKSKLILKEGLKKLDLAGIKVFLICGNHDPILAYNKITFNFDENSNIKIIGINTPEYGQFEVNDFAIIHAFSYKENHIKENPLQYFERAKANDKFNIGLLHCDLNADKASPYFPVSTTELNEFNYDYWALGHIHIPSDNEKIGYAGTIQGRNTKEIGAHGFKYIVVENNNIVQNILIPIDVIRYENFEINITQAEESTTAFDLILQNITSFIETEQNKNYKLLLLKVILTGSIGFYSELTQSFFDTLNERIKENFNNLLYVSEIINNTQPKINTNVLKEDDGISGEIYRTITEENATMAVNTSLEEFKNILNHCDFSDSELNELKEKITKKVKDKCLNLANNVYYNEERMEK